MLIIFFIVKRQQIDHEFDNKVNAERGKANPCKSENRKQFSNTDHGGTPSSNVKEFLLDQCEFSNNKRQAVLHMPESKSNKSEEQRARRYRLHPN